MVILYKVDGEHALNTFRDMKFSGLTTLDVTIATISKTPLFRSIFSKTAPFFWVEIPPLLVLLKISLYSVYMHIKHIYFFISQHSHWNLRRPHFSSDFFEALPFWGKKFEDPPQLLHLGAFKQWTLPKRGEQDSFVHLQCNFRGQMWYFNFGH